MITNCIIGATAVICSIIGYLDGARRLKRAEVWLFITVAVACLLQTWLGS